MLNKSAKLKTQTAPTKFTLPSKGPLNNVSNTPQYRGDPQHYVHITLKPGLICTCMFNEFAQPADFRGESSTAQGLDGVFFAAK